MSVPDPDLPAFLEGLGDVKHLVRERSLKRLTDLLTSNDELQEHVHLVDSVWDKANQLVQSNAWESWVGGLSAWKVLVQTCPTHMSQARLVELLHIVKIGFELDEPRVRVAAGELAGAMAAKWTAESVWKPLEPEVIRSITMNYDRDALDEDRMGSIPGPATSGVTQQQQQQQRQQQQGPQSDMAQSGSLLGSLLAAAYKPLVPGQGDMRHGTEGWRCLETSVRLVLQVVQGAGHTFASHVTPDFLALFCKCGHHPNRFVREATHHLLGALATALQLHDASQHQPAPHGCQQRQESTSFSTRVHSSQTDQGGDPPKSITLRELALAAAPLLADGLTDNWSQVRFAACVGTRALMLAVNESSDPAVAESSNIKEQLLTHLVPPLCLNRYYVADGVRSAAQETWQAVMGDRGRAAVARLIQPVSEYYIAQSKAVHHGVREAACACMAELAEKVDPLVVTPLMPLMIQAMLMCCKDMAWPVRDAGCSAAARCCRAIPGVCAPFVDQLLQLWTAHLWDNVQSVRVNSARALADVLHAYPNDVRVMTAIEKAIRDDFAMLNNQERDDPRGRSETRALPTQHTSSSSRGADTGDGNGVSQTDEQPSGTRHNEAINSRGGLGADQNGTSPVAGGGGNGVGGHVVVNVSVQGRPRSPGFGRSRSPTVSKGRPLSPARVYEMQMKAALAANPDLFSSGEDMSLFSEGAAARFSSSAYIKGDGCMDFGFSRDQEPWEAADGAVYMVAELAHVQPQAAVTHLEQVKEVVDAAQGFTGAEKLRESVWKVFPRIATGIGKQQLKRHLEPFLKPLFEDLSCGVPLTETAAGQALGALRDMLGANILAARLTDAQVHALRTSVMIPQPKTLGMGSGYGPV